MYLGKNVRIELSRNIYWRGKIIDIVGDYLKLVDFKGKTVMIRNDQILMIREE